VFGAFGLPYVILLGIGATVQFLSWLRLGGSVVRNGWMVAASIGWFVSLAACCVLREAIRIGSIDFEGAISHHQVAYSIEGGSLFLIAVVINGALIGYCIWVIQNRLQDETLKQRSAGG
jgi:hypothetical protein